MKVETDIIQVNTEDEHLKEIKGLKNQNLLSREKKSIVSSVEKNWNFICNDLAPDNTASILTTFQQHQQLFL